MASVKKMERALWRRKEHIRENLTTLNMKALRRLLEQDMGLNAKDLDPIKSEFSFTVDKILATFGESADAVEERDVPRSTPSKKQAKSSKSASKPVAKTTSADSGKHSAAVRKMQNICKQAAIGVGPNIYKKEDVEEAFKELLAKHGLSKSSGADEVSRVRRRLEKERDLEGIDLSNVVEGGRRKRGAAAAAEQKLKVVARDSSGTSDESDSESGGARPAKRRRVATAAGGLSEDTSGEHSDSGGGGGGSDSDDFSAGRSPTGDTAVRRMGRGVKGKARGGARARDTADARDSDEESDEGPAATTAKKRVALSESEEEGDSEPIVKAPKRRAGAVGAAGDQRARARPESDDGAPSSSESDDDNSDKPPAKRMPGAPKRAVQAKRGTGKAVFESEDEESDDADSSSAEESEEDDDDFDADSD